LAEAEHAFVSNPVYDREHTAAYLRAAIFLPRALNYYDRFAAGQNIYTQFALDFT